MNCIHVQSNTQKHIMRTMCSRLTLIIHEPTNIHNSNTRNCTTPSTKLGHIFIRACETQTLFPRRPTSYFPNVFFNIAPITAYTAKKYTYMTTLKANIKRLS
jgi:hypothetical protein